MSLSDFFDLPSEVVSAFSKGINNWISHVRIAVKHGITDVFDLTDIVFFLHHPERLGREIETWEQDAIKAWKDIQKRILAEFPQLRGGSDPVPKLSKAKAEKKLDAYIFGLKTSLLFLKPEILLVLREITNKDRQLLAIFGYLRYQHRNPGDIYDIWAWDDDEIAEYKKSAERKVAASALNQVKKSFNADSAMKKKAFKLSVAPHVRSLQKQITAWNGNKSVLTIGKKLRTILLREIRKPIYPDTPNAAGIVQLHKRLTADWKKGTLASPTNATPGLSSHGQMRAVDFHVKNGSGVKVGHSGNPQNWRDKGLSSALKDAVTEANKALGRTAFKGPLLRPDEPWHYTYIP
ncbi:MAG: hypothetical protein R3F53_23415 [Gammaproteobacteria bacterium]